MSSSSTARRLRSGTVTLGAIGVIALGLTGCGGTTEDRQCVDQRTNQVTNDANCRSSSGSGRWYYGTPGRGTGGAGVGTGTSGGDNSTTSGSYDRGGFGGSHGGSSGG